MIKAAIVAVLLIGLSSGQGGSSSALSGILAGKIPPATIRPDQPFTYRLITEYDMVGPQGAEIGTHVLSADFLADESRVHWTAVTLGQSAGHGQPATNWEHRTFVEGLRYPREARTITAPDFFRDFPPTANDEKNLVWDELMFQSFVANLDRLKLNEPVLAQSGDVNLAGSGTFTNRRIELTWRGVGRRNGEDCLLVHYEALLNRFTINSGPVTVAGRSDYFGDIWISISTRRIEYGTLLEEVAGTVGNVPGTDGPQPLHVLRTATLEHLK